MITLSACGGDTAGNITSTSRTVSGNVVKGPLNNALVFLDLNSNGIRDGGETAVRTDLNGKFTISTTATDYKIIAYTDDSTVDTSSGSVLSGITLSAPKNAAVITPTTTLMEEGGLTAAQVAEVLNLPDDIDPLSFNPFAAGVDATKALSVEKISHQIMTAINSFAAVAEGAGLTETAAFKTALNSVVDVVKVKAGKLNEAGVSTADKTLDFTKASDLNLIKDKIADEAEKMSAEVGHGPNGFTKNAITNLIDDTTASIKNVNDQITKLTEISSDVAKATFSNSQVLIDQVKSAAQAEATSSGTGSIDFANKAKVEQAAKNKAPSDIKLSSSKVSEDPANLLVGRLTTTDLDQGNGVDFKYKLAEVDGTDFSAFEINQQTGELSLKNLEYFNGVLKSSYTVVIQSTDDGGKTLSKTFEISVEGTGKKIDANNISSEHLASLGNDFNDKTLLIVIDDFSSRVHDYDNTTMYDYGKLEVVTYIDNYTNIYTGQTTYYGTFDDYFVDVPDYYGGFYQTTPDSDSNYLVDRDLISSGQFTDVLGNLANTETYLEFNKIGQAAEDKVLHGDWAVEAICQTLENTSNTEILCIDVDAFNGAPGSSFSKLFETTSYVLGDMTYTSSGVEKVISEFLYQNDARFNSGATKDVYEITGISMSISGIPTFDQSLFLKDLENYKIPFFQSAPNVNSGQYNYSNFFPNVISVGAWNVDANNYILAANPQAISNVDLYANGYVAKTGWGENFGTSFATPTVAAEYANLIQTYIKDLNASGKNLVDIQISNEELANINYTDVVNAVVSLISNPVEVEVSINNQSQKNTVQVLNETLINDGLNPVMFKKSGYGLDGVSFVKASYSGSNNLGSSIKQNEAPVKVNSNQADVAGPSFSDFTLLDGNIVDGGTIKARFKIADTSGFDNYPVNMQIVQVNGNGNYMVDFDPKKFVKKDGGYFEAESEKVVLPKGNYDGTFKINMIQMRDNLGNWTAFDKDSDLIKNLPSKTINISHMRETEANNSISTADSLVENIMMKGQTTDSGDKDFYKFSLSNKSNVSVNFLVDNDNTDYTHNIFVFNSNATKIESTSAHGEKELSLRDLAPGDYFLSIQDSFDSGQYTLILDIV